MCPSSKITADIRHSPKGRASIMREWLRLLAKGNIDINALEQTPASSSWFKKWRHTRNRSVEADFSHEVLEVMDGCLACKACSSQCPVNVDVPTFRARFLSIYYQRYLRPAKDYLVGNIEVMAPFMANAPGLVNFFLKQRWVNRLIKKTVGYVDTPHLSSPGLVKQLEGNNARQFDLAMLQALSAEQRARKVVVVQDPFTSFYEAEVVKDLILLIEKLGYEPLLLPFKPNGKPQHVKGFLREFAKTAEDSAAMLNQVAALGMPMVGVDPSLVLCYRDEYSKILGNERGTFEVMLVHEWLQNISLPKLPPADAGQYALFAHCTEKTALPASETHWQKIFAAMALELTPVAVGCCGMAGTYGHEASHLQHSRGIYELSWQRAISTFDKEHILATGYSCRSQVARFEGFKPKHPLQALLQQLS